MKVGGLFFDQIKFKYQITYAYLICMIALDYKSNCYTAINLNRDYHKTTTMVSDA